MILLNRQWQILGNIRIRSDIECLAPYPSGRLLIGLKNGNLVMIATRGVDDESPALSDDLYERILQHIYKVGLDTERLPSTYVGKKEEAIRDDILRSLAPHFAASTTAETFNKGGKTDILMRQDNANLFIAELKFWAGQKSFLEAITQLLGYLTWRDNKVALVILVKNKQMSKVLKTLQSKIITHANFVEYVKEQNEGFYRYRFHHNDDSTRIIELAVICFHLV